jgi:arsenate reductase
MSEKTYNVLFLCTGNSAGKVCPFWPGQPVTAHWGFRDPAAAVGSTADIRHAFATVCRKIKTRLDIFRSLPLEKLDKLALKRERDQIGEVQS